MTTISPVPLPNLYDLDTQSPRMTAVYGGAALAASANVSRDLTQPAASARELAEGDVVHHGIVRYTQAQMDMRPVDRADAALMAVTEPDTFRQFVQAVSSDGDWRSILEPYAQRLQQHPEWLEDNYRLPAADLLRQSDYLMNLGVLVQLGLADPV